MAKLLSLIVALMASSASAFAPVSSVAKKTSLSAAGDVWDPMGFYELGSGKAFDTFPGVFPDKQYLQASEIKQGRMAMLAWTGVWATTKVRLKYLYYIVSSFLRKASVDGTSIYLD